MNILRQFNWIDIIVVILVLRTVFVGVTRGFTKDFFNLLAILTAGCLAVHYYIILADFLKENWGLSERTAILISFIFLTISSICILKIIIYLFLRLVKIEFHSVVEKIGGFFIGLVHGIALASLLLLIFNFSETEYVHSSLKRSFLTPHIIGVVPNTYNACIKVLPADASKSKADIKMDFLDK